MTTDPIKSYERALTGVFSGKNATVNVLRTIGRQAARRSQLSVPNLRAVAAHIRLCGPPTFHHRLELSQAGNAIARGIELWIAEHKGQS